MKEIANFFWHGDLSLFEIKCMQSFIRAGFHVKLWSYTNLSVEGAESCDARLVLPQEDLTRYSQYHENLKDSAHCSIAAFSDAFRYTLLRDFDGWWFDTDCYCLKNVNEFIKLRQNKDIVTGLQIDGNVACGVIYVDKSIATSAVNDLNATCIAYGYNVPWGSIGPGMMKSIIEKNTLHNQILPSEYFYAIDYTEMNLFCEKEFFTTGVRRIKNSYVTHIWDTFIKMNSIDKNDPPIGSLLYNLLNDKIK